MAKLYVIKTGSPGAGGAVVVTPSGLAISDTGVVTGIALTTAVTGTLPVANGGTGITAFGAGVATALGTAIGTANGIVIYDGSGHITSLTVGAGGFSSLGTGGFADALTASTTIELGHASDTTLSRLSAGQVSIEGVQIATATNNIALAKASLALGGATIGSNALAVTGTANFGGIVTYANGAFSAPSLVFTASGTSGFYSIAAGNIGYASGGNPTLAFASNELRLTTGVALGWASPNSHSANDTSMTRLAAGVMGVPGIASTPQAVVTTDGAAAAVNLTTLTSTYVTGASSNTTTTLAAGTNGQIKIISLITDGGQNLVVTVTNAFWGGAGELTFNDAGDNVMLIYLNSKWQILVNNGVTAA